MSQAPTVTKLPPATAWQAESLRLSVFPVPNVTFDHAKWWRDVTGTEADSTNNQPKQGLYEERGNLDEHRVLVLRVQVPRIDWFLLSPESQVPSSDFAAVGAFPDVIGQFSAMLDRWLGVSPAVSRFALGGVLIQPQPDRKAGYEQLGAYLAESVKVDPDSSDFMYQINRTRPSRHVAELQINRLTKWSVALHRMFVFSPGQESSISTMARQSACRLEFDINTAQDFKGPLPQAKLSELRGEFGSLALEIAERGDVK